MSVRQRGDEAAEREEQQPEVDGGLAAPAVGQPAERNLQQRLREAVGAERDADQRVAAAAAAAARRTARTPAG